MFIKHLFVQKSRGDKEMDEAQIPASYRSYATAFNAEQQIVVSTIKYNINHLLSLLKVF